MGDIVEIRNQHAIVESFPLFGLPGVGIEIGENCVHQLPFLRIFGKLDRPFPSCHRNCFVDLNPLFVRFEAFDVVYENFSVVPNVPSVWTGPERPIAFDVWTSGVVFSQFLFGFPATDTIHGSLVSSTVRSC